MVERIIVRAIGLKKHLQSSFRLLLSLSCSAVGTSLVSPSKVTLFPRTQAHARSGQEREQTERFPPEVRCCYSVKNRMALVKKQELTMETQKDKIHKEETKESHNPGKRYWQIHSYRINDATAGPKFYRMDMEQG